jgi:hypothetical protein
MHLRTQYIASKAKLLSLHAACTGTGVPGPIPAGFILGQELNRAAVSAQFALEVPPEAPALLPGHSASHWCPAARYPDTVQSPTAPWGCARSNACPRAVALHALQPLVTLCTGASHHCITHDAVLWLDHLRWQSSQYWRSVQRAISVRVTAAAAAAGKCRSSSSNCSRSRSSGNTMQCSSQHWQHAAAAAAAGSRHQKQRCSSPPAQAATKRGGQLL